LELALKTAQESLVMLKNSANFLPLKQDSVHSIAVIGPAGDQNYETGNYYGTPAQKIGPLQGPKQLLGPQVATLASSVSAAVDLSTFFKQRTQRLRRDAVPDHWRVYRAIAASDPKAARQAMRQLVKLAFADTTAAAINGESVNLSAP